MTIENGPDNYHSLPPPENGGTPIYYFSVCCASHRMKIPPTEKLASFRGSESSNFNNKSTYTLDSYTNGSFDFVTAMYKTRCKNSSCHADFTSPSGILEPGNTYDWLIDQNPTGSR